MIQEVFMPALSSTMTEGKIVDWVKSPGDRIEKGETVVIVESDKADMDVESFYEGYLATIIVPSGEVIAVGEPIALIAETEAEIETAKQQASGKTQTQAQAPVASTPTPTASPAPSTTVADSSVPLGSSVAAIGAQNGRTIATPRARKLAKSLKVDLNTLRGSGPHGRIVAADVEAAAGVPQVTPPVQPTSIPATVPVVTPPIPMAPASPAPITQPGSVPLGQVVPLNTLQSAVVRNMVSSLQVPTYRVGYTITTDTLDALYKQVKSKGVTMTALLAKAVAVTLQKHPLVNAAYTENGIQYSAVINVAIAVAMPDGGLITPVLQNADKGDLYSLSRSWKDLVERSRLKQLKPEEYNSGTFTVSNLGMFGVDRFDAILPPGQGSILAIGASRPTVVATDDGLIGVRRQMQVNLTCDHRIIYGADAAAFLKDLATLIEANPHSLTL